MSTDYYKPALPVTSLRSETTGNHTNLSIWTNRGLSGTLVLRTEDYSEFVTLLCQGRPVLHVSHAGYGKLAVQLSADDNLEPLEDDTVLISASGEITTVGKVKALAET